MHCVLTKRANSADELGTSWSWIIPRRNPVDLPNHHNWISFLPDDVALLLILPKPLMDWLSPKADKTFCTFGITRTLPWRRVVVGEGMSERPAPFDGNTALLRSQTHIWILNYSVVRKSMAGKRERTTLNFAWARVALSAFWWKRWNSICLFVLTSALLCEDWIGWKFLNAQEFHVICNHSMWIFHSYLIL